MMQECNFNPVEKTRKFRNFFLKEFLIAYILVIITSAVYYFHSDWYNQLCHNMFGLTDHQTGIIMLVLIGIMKIMALFFFLIPALALQWEYAVLKRQALKEETNKEAETK